MKKTLTRVTVVAMAVTAIMIMLFAFGQENVHAAFDDRTVDGAVTMPASRTLSIPVNKAVKIKYGTSRDDTNYYYYKIKPAKTGTIKFTKDYGSGWEVALCNSKKKLISRGEKKNDDFYSAKSQYAYQMVLYYGVKKGVTYYIRVKGASGEHESYDAPYVGSVKWTLSKVKASKYGKKKSKAKAIKKKKTVKGIFVAGNKKAQWFKITNKQKTTKIYFKSPRNNGSLKATIYYKSLGRWYTQSAHVYRSAGSNVITGIISRKVKHTYYLKITPENKTSGYYTLKWK